MSDGAQHGSEAAAPGRARGRRLSGKPFAIGFGLFLVIGTVVFTYLARQAQREREQAFDRMEDDGVVQSGQ